MVVCDPLPHPPPPPSCSLYTPPAPSRLPRGVQVGRSEVSAVAERRKSDIELFLATLFSRAEHVVHANLVYTFLHPLLRDQEDTNIHETKLRKTGTEII